MIPLQAFYRIINKANKNIIEIMTDVSVIVDSRGGNTRKVADAIAEEMGITAKNVTPGLTDDAKLLFLGSGTYRGKAGEKMMTFIDTGDFSGRKVAIFGTSASLAGGQKMINAMTDALTKKGATIAGAYHCKGKMLVINWGHPNKEDLENAKKFARMMKKD
jgi:flavodoxin